MDFTYDIVTAKSDKKAQIGIHFCHTINTIIELFLSTFLIGHIYSFATDIYDYIFKASIYEIVSYFVMLITYQLSSKIVNRTNRVSVYRASTMIWAIFLIFAIFYGEQIAQMLWLAGFLCGLARGVYWSSFNVLKQEMVGKSKMNSFSTFSMVLQKTVSVIFPLTLGVIIDKTAYSTAAIIVLMFCLLQIAMSFMIKSQHPVGSDYSLKAYFKRLKENTPLNARLKFLYFFSFIFGANTTVTTIVNIAIMLQFGSSSSLGAITSAMAAAVIIATILIGKFTKNGKRTPLYATFVGLIALAVAAYIVAPTKTMFIVLDFVLSIGGVVFKLVFDIYRNKFLKEYGRYDDIAEHQGVIEGIIQLSRIVSYAILIVFSLFRNVVVINIVFMFFLALFASNLVLLIIFEKKFYKPEKQQAS